MGGHCVKRLLVSLVLAACAANAASAASDPLASEESVRKLLEVTESRKMLESVWQHVETSMDVTLQQLLGDQKLTDKQRKQMDEVRARVVAIMREELSWEFMESMMMEVYTKTFTQQEVDGMLAFYASPAGRSVITKMPVAMQHSMEIMQQRMATMIPKLQQMQKEMVAQVQGQK
jgi:hypothetical protein